MNSFPLIFGKSGATSASASASFPPLAVPEKANGSLLLLFVG